MTHPRTTPSAARRRRTVPARMPSGFTLVELLVVIVVLAILTALLLPAINAAIRTARTAAVSSEINSLAQALASFKSKYGDYPPSRILLAEDGDYSAATVSPGSSPSLGTGDITLAQLAQRSVTALRRFFPRALFNTNGNQVFPAGSSVWYDFNGNGGTGPDPHYILQGHECLVFFLGGIPVLDGSTGSFGMQGFGKDPTNPFTNPAWTIGGNRLPPLFEFNGSRLYTDPTNTSMNGSNPGIPGYYDSFNNASPTTGSLTRNFYVYFSAYGNSSYDPNDVNFPSEQDVNGNTDIGLYFPNGPSYAPNPYTITQTVGTTTGLVTFQSPQTFQIISPGVDGLYGVGGQFLGGSKSTSSEVLPFDSRVISNVPVTFYGTPPSVTEETASVRTVERDNVTNFKSGRLE